MTQNGVPFMQPEELKNTITHLKHLFADASCYLATVPTYVGGPMALGWATDAPSHRAVPLAELEARFRKADFKTRYYTPVVHQAAFALPVYISDLLG